MNCAVLRTRSQLGTLAALVVFVACGGPPSDPGNDLGGDAMKPAVDVTGVWLLTGREAIGNILYRYGLRLELEQTGATVAGLQEGTVQSCVPSAVGNICDTRPRSGSVRGSVSADRVSLELAAGVRPLTGRMSGDHIDDDTGFWEAARTCRAFQPPVGAWKASTFRLTPPDGSAVDLVADLGLMVRLEVAQGGAFTLTVDTLAFQGQASVCDEVIELETQFEGRVFRFTGSLSRSADDQTITITVPDAVVWDVDGDGFIDDPATLEAKFERLTSAASSKRTPANGLAAEYACWRAPSFRRLSEDNSGWAAAGAQVRAA